MSNTEASVNDTIIHMITDLKPRSMKFTEYTTPLKRSLSSASNTSNEEIPTPKKPKRESILDVSYVGSPREIRRLRADLLSSRNQILNLQNQIQHMHGVRKEIQIMFDNELATLNSQCARDSKNVDELEMQLQSLRKREIELKEQLSEEKNKYNQLKIKSDTRIEELEKELSELSSDMKFQDNEENSEANKLRNQINELEMLYDAAQEETEAYKKLSDELNSRMSDLTKLRQDLDIKDQLLQKTRIEIKELDYIKETHLEIQQQAKTQQHKLSTYNDLERENKKLKDEVKNLKDEVHNKLVLEEEVHNLKSRLINYKEHEKKLAFLQVNKAQNDMYLEEWRAVARSICETDAPDMSLQKMLQTLVERLQQQEINLTSEKIQFESQLKTTTHDARVAEAEAEKNQKLVTELQNNIQQRQNLIHRMQKKLLLVSRERDSYRKQLDSYEKDLTICMAPSSSATPGVNQIQTQKERIDNLERVVDGYRDMVQKLENDLQNVESPLTTEAVPVRIEQVKRLQEEIDSLKNDNVLLRQRKDYLEIQMEELLVGQDTVQGRVVHPAKNPLMDCIKQRENSKEKLTEEVERLKRKIRNLEEGLEASKLNESTISTKEVVALKEQVKSSEAHVERLKECFRNSMQEFRNTIYTLLGYKIDKTSKMHYKLTSMYAERAEDQICFKLNPDGALDLLENEFSAGLEELVDLHLKHQKSIPVFLSTITLDLFHNKTMTTKAFMVEDDDDDD